jgi:hypothetical protein
MPEEWRQAQYMADVKARANSSSSSELIEEEPIEIIDELEHQLAIIHELDHKIEELDHKMGRIHELDHKMDRIYELAYKREITFELDHELDQQLERIHELDQQFEIIDKEFELLDKKFNFLMENSVIQISENDCSSDVKSNISITLDEEIHSPTDPLDVQLAKKHKEFYQEAASEEFRDLVLKDLDIKIFEKTLDNENLKREIEEQANIISYEKPDIIISDDGYSDSYYDYDRTQYESAEDSINVETEIAKFMYDIDKNMDELDRLDELVQFAILDNIELLKIDEERTKYILNIERNINAINKLNA